MTNGRFPQTAPRWHLPRLLDPLLRVRRTVLPLIEFFIDIPLVISDPFSLFGSLKPRRKFPGIKAEKAPCENTSRSNRSLNANVPRDFFWKPTACDALIRH